MKTPATNPSWGLTVFTSGCGECLRCARSPEAFQVGLAGLAGIFGSLHIPLPLVSAVFATLVEFVGGIVLLLGVFTRWAAALIASELLVAVLVTYLEPGFFKKAGG
jgi:putative oxidoreductase